MSGTPDIQFKQMMPEDLDHIDFSGINNLLSQLTGNDYTFTKEQFKSILLRDGIYQFYAHSSNDDTEVVGLLTLVVFHTPAGSHARIEDVVVDLDFRGKSIGRILTEMALEKARDLKISEVDLTSNPRREAANRLYQKMGFMRRDTNVYRYKNQ